MSTHLLTTVVKLLFDTFQAYLLFIKKNEYLLGDVKKFHKNYRVKVNENFLECKVDAVKSRNLAQLTLNVSVCFEHLQQDKRSSI